MTKKEKQNIKNAIEKLNLSEEVKKDLIDYSTLEKISRTARAEVYKVMYFIRYEK